MVPDTWVEAALKLTALQRLRLGAPFWLQLLPHLASFPNLKDIGEVPFQDRDVVETVASLTALTRLRARTLEDFASSPALSCLSAPQALSLCSNKWRGAESDIEALIRAVTQLTELAITCDSLDEAELNRVLVMAPLRRLKSLHLRCVGLRVASPIRVLRNAPLHGLRILSITLDEDNASESVALCAALPGLERLSVVTWKSAAQGLVPHLSQLSRLSALRIEAHSASWRTPHSASRRLNSRDVCVRASFLTGLTGLVDLKLRHVLSARNAVTDIPCLATLTRLQWLVVESVSHDDGDWDPSQAQFLSVEAGDLQPLSALRMLEAYDLHDAWVWAGDTPMANSVSLRDLQGVHLHCPRQDYEEYDPMWRGSAFTRDISCTENDLR